MDEARLLLVLEDAAEEARRRAPGAIACAAGCGECCHRMFAITEADAARLRRGLESMERTDPARAAGIRERARAAWDRVKADFPGDAETGILKSNEEWRDWFWARTQGVPCPVQDPESQACSMYEHRTAACRLYGPLIRVGEEWSGPCPKCYAGFERAEMEAAAPAIDVDEWGEEGPETTIAAAIALAAKGLE
ncbi:MAG: YkgJ family cysteine cluster protein [Bryobacteraceae bacterium]